MAKQLSVFLENKAGRLARVTRVLGEASINIRAHTILKDSCHSSGWQLNLLIKQDIFYSSTP